MKMSKDLHGIQTIPKRFLGGVLIKGALPIKQEEIAFSLTANTVAELRELGLNVDFGGRLAGNDTQFHL